MWRGQTCDSDQLRDVALRWQVVGHVRDSVYLQEFTQQLGATTLNTDLLQAWQLLAQHVGYDGALDGGARLLTTSFCHRGRHCDSF